MAVKINIEGIGEVVAENFAQEDTLKQLVEVMSKSDKTKRREETERAAAEKKEADAKKKNAKATQDATSGIEDLYKENEKKIKSIVFFSF